MTSRKFFFLTAWLAVVALALGACSESSNTPVDPDTDTTAPLVASTFPAAGQVDIASYANITITFNEAMDQASCAGQVTVTPGGAGALSWLSDRQVSIANPGGWVEGQQVQVALGTGMRDLAGNALASVHQFSFFVESTALLFLASEPADAETGVNRSASLRLQFTHEVDESSLLAGVTITDAAAKVAYPFTVSSGGGNNWYTLDPTGTLPAATLFTVTMGAGICQAGNQANTLGTQAAWHFTTGVDVDTTPPTIVSFSPADGATNVASDVGMLSITFSEPVDPATFEPVSWNMEFAVIFMAGPTQPNWSAGNTVMTVALPPLPAGLEMAIGFSGFADASGNVQSAVYQWDARAAGTADVYPQVDGLRQYWQGAWSRGVAGNETPTQAGDLFNYRQVEVQVNGDIHVVDYENELFATARRWDIYDRLAASIEWLGFADNGGDGGTPSAILFDSTLKYLPLPMVAGTWTDNTTVTVPGEGAYTATFTGHVIGREDVPLDPRKFADGAKVPLTPLYYKGAWKVARSMSVELGGEWFTTMSDTVWYSPTLGPVHEITREEYAARDLEPAGWYRTDSWRDPTAGLGEGK